MRYITISLDKKINPKVNIEIKEKIRTRAIDLIDTIHHYMESGQYDTTGFKDQKTINVLYDLTENELASEYLWGIENTKTGQTTPFPGEASNQ